MAGAVSCCGEAVKMLGKGVDQQRAVVQDADAIGDAFDIGQEGRAEQHRAAGVGEQVDQRIEELAPHHHIEPEGWVVVGRCPLTWQSHSMGGGTAALVDAGTRPNVRPTLLDVARQLCQYLLNHNDRSCSPTEEEAARRVAVPAERRSPCRCWQKAQGREGHGWSRATRTAGGEVPGACHDEVAAGVAAFAQQT